MTESSESTERSTCRCALDRASLRRRRGPRSRDELIRRSRRCCWGSPSRASAGAGARDRQHLELVATSAGTSAMTSRGSRRHRYRPRGPSRRLRNCSIALLIAQANQGGTDEVPAFSAAAGRVRCSRVTSDARGFGDDRVVPGGASARPESGYPGRVAVSRRGLQSTCPHGARARRLRLRSRGRRPRHPVASPCGTALQLAPRSDRPAWWRTAAETAVCRAGVPCHAWRSHRVPEDPSRRARSTNAERCQSSAGLGADAANRAQIRRGAEWTCWARCATMRPASTDPPGQTCRSTTVAALT